MAVHRQTKRTMRRHHGASPRRLMLAGLLGLGAAAHTAAAVPSLDSPELAQGPYAAMKMTLKKTILYGGHDGTDYINQLWTWDGTAWTQVKKNNGPPRALMTLWYDTTVKKTRPYRPQTNGKVERYNRTLLAEWAYARPWSSDSQRARGLTAWLHLYNHHRHHTAIGCPPIRCVSNLSGHYN